MYGPAPLLLSTTLAFFALSQEKTVKFALSYRNSLFRERYRYDEF